MNRILSVLIVCQQVCQQLCSCIQMSPVVFCISTAVVLIIGLLVFLFNVCLARLFTIPGAFILNLGLFFLLLRWVVRILVFPGSILCWKRNTEATYRVEMAKQWMQQLEQLHAFLKMATNRPASSHAGMTLEGVQAGCHVIEGLARNLRVQQRDQVKFTAEQAHMRLLVSAVESWIHSAKVCDKRNGKAESQVNLTDWIHRILQSGSPVPLSYAVATHPLVKESEVEVPACIERLEQLIIILDGLQRQQDSFCASARRFLQVPTVGSLHQLRAELLVKYSGQHHWVRTPSGRKIDAMFIACQGAAGLDAEDAPKDDALSTGSNTKEDVPLKEVVSEAAPCAGGPVIVWCNPNAGYYETMAYESHWLDFYLSQGCSVLLFNYSGFGRSEGHPTPRAVASDGNAVIEFLTRRGFSQIGVHGRSIGGICACSLAEAHPDVVKILIADRTFSTLAKVAKYTFGNWAVQGLGLSATWADNHKNYEKSRCYKVMICDPKDATIPDLAALRTAVALDAVSQVPECNRFHVEDEKIERLAKAWTFFETLIHVCSRMDSPPQGQQCTSCRGSMGNEATGIGKPQVEQLTKAALGGHEPAPGSGTKGPQCDGDNVEAHSRNEGGEGGEDDTQRLVTTRSRLEAQTAADARKPTITETWLEEHADAVQTVLAQHIDAIRVALDIVGTQLNASGMTLENALSRPSLEEACEALRCFVANLQAWGSLSTCRDMPLSAHRDIEAILQQGIGVDLDTTLVSARLDRLASNLTPEKVSIYHRQLTQTMMSRVRREFRQQTSRVRRNLEQASCDYGSPGSALCATILTHFCELESFVTTICRFFRSVDIASQSAATSGGVASSLMSDCGTGAPANSDSEEGKESIGRGRAALPLINAVTTGFVVCIDCGHNGVLSDSELQHLSMHLRAARFGKYRSLTERDAKDGALWN